ncbi:hypothetical protein [Bacillus sp. 03113]|uniref:hypothetical protein n=1 Tax=Bacillus sp. 03113 TaxID=2578211 RepID=UPI00215C0498|nr:hypothetical protein [Bacillus sp. 03113]
MKTSVPCPQCEVPITLDDFEDFSSPFTMKCPHCKTKLKESRVTPWLLLIAVIMIPIFIYITEKVKDLLSDIFPAIDKIPAVIVFLGVLYPVYALYERFNGLIMFNKGNLQMKNSYKDFWTWFVKHSDDYLQLNEEHLGTLFHKLEKQLSKINPDLTFEFSVDLVDGKREFIISADGILSAFPAVEGLVNEAPNFEDFKIIAFRQRGEDFNIKFNEIELLPENVFFTYDQQDDGINLYLYIKGFDSQNDDMITASFILLDTLIGEYDVATKLDKIEILPFEADPKLDPIIELPSLIDSMDD